MDVPPGSLTYGFVTAGLGGHSGRTIMLEELRNLLNYCSPDAELDEYRQAILVENVLGKPTGSAREKAHRYLRQLYSLDPKNLVFQSLRILWKQSTDAQPLLALLSVVARDPLLRSTVNRIIELPDGEAVTAQDFSEIVQGDFPNLTGKTLKSIGQNIASSWSQSGHLMGIKSKTRQKAHSNSVSTAYTLLLAYLCGYRGDALFENDWVRLLDTPTHTLREQAQQASQQGWLEYRQSGTITEITFRHFLKEAL